MPIKGIFNRNNKKEHPMRSSNEIDKQNLRINALEVHIKKMLEFEKQFRASMYGTAKKENEASSRNDGNNTSVKNLQQKVHSRDNDAVGKEYPKVNELSRRIEKLEKIVRGISLHQYDSNTRAFTSEKESKEAKRLHEFSEESHSSSSSINMRVLALERNYLLVNEVQASMIKRIDELVEKHNELLKKWEETEGAAIEKIPIFKTLYIDKFYLDKYEQNNNFSQIGIHELSGALNIGATYGKEVIPKKITEEVKEEMEKMKAAKEEMVKQQTSSDQPDKPQTDESSSDLTHIPLDEEPYTDISIEDDPSFD